jgi:hypothetical protein
VSPATFVLSAPPSTLTVTGSGFTASSRGRLGRYAARDDLHVVGIA